VVHIQTIILDSTGATVGSGRLPVSFDCEADAIDFMRRFIPLTFAYGKSGYQAADRYWWGCDATPRLEVHRFTIKWNDESLVRC
jgi:hypothetical protein